MSRYTETEPAKHNMATLYLVSCVSEKRPARVPARCLYMSDWFQKARAYVESAGRPWFILSAKHGLLHPETVVCPYDKTLKNMSKAKRGQWSWKVLNQLQAHLGGVDCVVILAGKSYREFLEPGLLARGIDVRVPMCGLGIGKQLQWLKRPLSSPDRLYDMVRFYDILDRLKQRVGGSRVLSGCDGRMNWPKRGVYFFFEEGEKRSGSGKDRVVRVGTHAPNTGAKTTLWDRLSQHRGPAGRTGGNHRSSVFRKLVGAALACRKGLSVPSWGVGSSISDAADKLGTDKNSIKAAEADLEARVSEYIGSMPFLWLNVPDPPGPGSLRGFIERNAIALLSGYCNPELDPPSPQWLGRLSNRPLVRASGLWNNRHVDEPYDPSFLDEMEKCVDETEPL